MRYRYFCWGVVLTSVSWAAMIMLYTSHLEKVSKQSMTQQRQKIRQEMGLGTSGKKNNPFPHVDLDDKAAWEFPVDSKGYSRKGSMKRKPAKYSVIDSWDNEKPVILTKHEGVDFKPINGFAGVGAAPPHQDSVDKPIKPLSKPQHNYNSPSFAHLQSPKPAPAVDLDALAVIRNKDDQAKRDFGYNRYAFNSLISDRIGPRRQIPDSRHKLCQVQQYPTVLPAASIIICFYNEAPSALVRMIQSIMDRTPVELIHELLLIDDLSDDAQMLSKVIQLGKTELKWPVQIMKTVRTRERMGLIRAKVFGSRMATGEVLVFLDSHCEVNEAWLQPLLYRIQQSPNSVVCPIIDIIDSDTFKYHESPVCKGGFNWGLFFKWDYPPWTYFKTEMDYIKPLNSPTMAGGLFAIRKQYFEYLGEYDEGMDVWGAENVEISFRIWMCGGSLEIMPCSRVGHIFRKRRPYGLTGVDTMAKNSLRTAHVWLDEYKEKFLKARPSLRHMDAGNMSSRIELRHKLQCKSFNWYLHNIYPDLLPKEEEIVAVGAPVGVPFGQKLTQPNIIQKYYIRSPTLGLCLISADVNRDRGSYLTLALCSPSDRTQVWYETDLHEFRLAGKLCLDAYKGARIQKCDMQRAYQLWKRTGSSGKLLYNAASGLCLNAVQKGSMAFVVHMDICNEKATNVWDMLPAS